MGRVPGVTADGVHNERPAGSQAGRDGREELGTLAARHAVDDTAQDEAAQTGRGHGTEVLGHTFRAQVQDAELGSVHDVRVGIDAVGVAAGGCDATHQPPVAAGGVQHVSRRLGHGGDRRLDPPGIGTLQLREFDHLVPGKRSWTST